MLEVALSCIRRGWYVFPCWPKSKKPMTAHGWHDASIDEAAIRAWWTKTPDANVAIACNPSGLAVVDIDHGLKDQAALSAFWAMLPNPEKDFEETYAVRTGRRPEYGVQLYFVGTVPDVGLFKLLGCEGQVKSLGGYVMAAGSVHPDSGELYEELQPLGLPLPVLKTPQWVRELKSEKTAVADDEPITSNRNVALTSIAGKLRNAGLSADALEVALVQVNADRCVPPMDDDEVKRIASNAARWELPKPDAVAVLGKQEKPVDWRSRYMTLTAFQNVKPPEFLIDGFLVKGSIAMLAGPVAQRKSIIALNIAHALCTGEALFDYFNVSHTPDRIVYLCPEMGASSFVKRIKQIGLGEYIGKSLFIQTLSEEQTPLDSLGDELPGAVVIVDTIVRYVEGNENDSADMRLFSQKIFRLANAGATVVLLHHSKKGSAGSLDDGLRGSSELAAFVDSCWVTGLDDPKRPYESLSMMRNTKQRDFESDPFKLRPSSDSYRLTMDGEPESDAVVKSKTETAARDLLKTIIDDDPKTGINKIQAKLRAAGYGKGAKWIKQERMVVLGTGVTHVEAVA